MGSSDRRELLDNFCNGILPVRCPVLAWIYGKKLVLQMNPF
jgi:hypothetical protein